ncbi:MULTISPECIES: hypothetical protein [Actinomadura]|uniref:hypothetical protein n=1 Tax=Actinomadura TaxID=1988 RepID=UPI0003FE3572|nr:hypothetical protein [Actinomadura madurae]MCP9978166.1 hypothetical protein [Actinomadura madurae]
MICPSCREHRHEECRGGSWCDCQHRPEPATPGDERRDDGPATGRDGEPPVNWRRQG